MKLYWSDTYSDEDGTADEAKSAMIYSTKEDLLKICDFFEKVKEHIEVNNLCHMHLRDDLKDWKKGEHFDLEVNLIDDAE